MQSPLLQHLHRPIAELSLWLKQCMRNSSLMLNILVMAWSLLGTDGRETEPDSANTLGNLVNRTISMSNKYFGGVVTKTGVTEEVDEDLKAVVTGTKAKVAAKMEDLRVADFYHRNLQPVQTLQQIHRWDHAVGTGKRRREERPSGRVLYNLVESITIGASLLESFMPETTEKILAQLNGEKRSYEELDQFGLYPSEIK